MSTVNFSVPENVKQTFNAVFEGQNKSAIIAELMLEAVEREERKQRSREAYKNIVARRKHAPKITENKFRTARAAGRS